MVNSNLPDFAALSNSAIKNISFELLRVELKLSFKKTIVIHMKLFFGLRRSINSYIPRIR